MDAIYYKVREDNAIKSKAVYCLIGINREGIDKQWSKKYPYIIKSWLENWNNLSQMFEFPAMIRKMIYMTNIIESFNSQLRKVTKSKRVFTNDQALMKLLYLVQIKVLENVKPIANWKQIMAQFIILSTLSK